MRLERTNNTVKGILSGGIKQVVNQLLPFVSRTVILYVLGTQYLGLGSLFSAILSMLSITELGVSNALVYSMYKPIAENDSTLICALLSLYRKLYRIIGSIILVLGLACMPFLHILIKGECPPDINIYLLYGIYLTSTVSSYFLFAYRGSLLTAHQRTDIDSIINTIVPLAIWILQMIMLAVFKSYYAYVAFLPISNIVTNIVRLFAVKKYYPQYVPKGKVPTELSQSIFKKIKALLGAKISTVILHSSDNIVISAFLGLTMVTIYGNYFYIMNAVCVFVGIAYSPMLPGIGNSLATEGVEKNYSDFKKFSFINLWIIAWCAICLVCLYQPFMELWVGKDLMFPFYVVLELALYFVVKMGRKIPVTYKDAAGLWWEDRFRPLVIAAVNVVSNVILVQLIGISGIILSTVLSLLISIPWENYTVFKYIFKRSSKEYYLSLVQYFAVFILGGAATLAACQVVQSGIVAIVIRAVICLVVPNALFLLAFRKRPEFAQAKQLLMRIVKRRK